MNTENMKKIIPGKANVIVSKKIPIPKLNYQILKYLITERKARILFISIEKPHQYMTYILGMHGVPQRNITYLDLENSKIKFPITLSNMKNLHMGGFLRREIIVLKDYDYVVVDNLEHLQHVWTNDSIREFLKTLVDDARKYGTSLIIPVRSIENCSGKIAMEMCDEKIDIDEVRA